MRLQLQQGFEFTGGHGHRWYQPQALK